MADVATTSTTKTTAVGWLRDFEAMLAARDVSGLGGLFTDDSAWRDILAFTGDLRTLHGKGSIEETFKRFLDADGAASFSHLELVSADINARTGREAIEAVFRFDSAAGKADGVVRLVEDETGSALCWTLMTVLSKLDENLVRKPAVRASEHAYEGQERRNWLDFRNDELEYRDRDPEVLIVGAGQCGLALAARLQQFGIDTLLVDKHERVGDNWRNRYHVLRLHNEKGSNHLPFMPFPDSWPTYIPKDKLGDWLETYARSMELNVWNETSFDSGEFDDEAKRWDVTISRNGQQRRLRPKHVVMAIGVSGVPKLPAIPGLDDFAGTIVHSSDYVNGASFKGQRVLVVGTGVSGHDIAQDLYWHGATVSMLQRSKTIIASLRPGAEKVYAHYRSNDPLDELDLLNVSVPYPVKRERAQRLTEEIRQLDDELLKGLNAAGFRTHTGSDGTGFQMQFLREGGGYYIDVGCSQLIAKGEVEVLDAHETSGFDQEGLVFSDGSRRPFDSVFLATGYQSVSDAVANMLGSDVAEAVGPVWGLDDEGELRNICRPTAREGLWFIAGGLAEARIFSKFLALQLAADLSGIPVAPGR